MNDLGSPIDRVAAASELFGIRGQSVTNILGRLDKAASGGALTFDQFTAKLKAAQGTAKQMADIRLDNLSGQLEQLGGAVDALAIGIFTGPQRGFSDLVKMAATAIGGIANAMDDIREGFARTDVEAKYGKAVVAVAYGIIDGVEAVGGAIDSITDAVARGSAWFEKTFGLGTIETIARLAIEFGAVAMALAPFLASFVTIGFLLSSVIIPAVSGLGTVLSAVLGLISGPVLLGAAAAFAAIGIALAVVQREGESMGDTLVRVLMWIRDTAVDLYQNVLLPFWEGFSQGFTPVLEELQVIWSETIAIIRDSIEQIAAQFAGATDGIEMNWVEVGRTVVSVVGSIVVTVAQVAAFIVSAFALVAPTLLAFAKNIHTFVMTPFQMVYNSVRRVWEAVQMLYAGDVLSGLARLGVAILDAILVPLRYVVTQVSKLAELLGVEVPGALKTFGREGISGLIWPEREAPRIATAAAKEAPMGAPKVAQLSAQVAAAQATPIDLGDLGNEVAKALQKNPPKVESHHNIKVDNKVNLDGKEVSRAVTQHQTEVWERSGAKATPWQRNVIREQGALPAPSGAR
jgi:hypothetical protein